MLGLSVVFKDFIMSKGDEELNKEDLVLAKKAMKSYLKGANKLYAAQGASGMLNVVANLADKFSRNDKGEFSPGWFYGYFVSNILSGASAELLENIMVHKYMQTSVGIQNKLHQEFDSFSITERDSRKTEKILNDVQAITTSTNSYLGAKGSLISTAISVGVMTGLTIASGGLANLPVMGGVMVASAASSYLLNKKMNKSKIKQKNDIRMAQGDMSIQTRHLYTNSVEREINDPTKKEYDILKQKQDAYSGKYKNFVKMLCKYAATGTLIKTAIVGAAVATAWGNPTNLLVLTGAALSTYGAMNRCVNSVFSLKEHLGNFAHAYKSFRPKVKDVSYGKESIKGTANVIELDNISFNHRDADDITSRREGELFCLDGKIHIEQGITVLSGASGAGKSSLINLLVHSDNLKSGAIRIGEKDADGNFSGTSYTDLQFGEPARHIGFDLQRGKLSQMTVNDYITMANPNASPELVSEVKELLGIKDKPENNSDIDANLVIDNEGKGISGGQISRLKLAQTLIKDSPIMVLDEPTTGIDAAMSENIINYVNGMKDKKTIVYITHNVNEIKNLDTYQAIDIDKKEGEDVAHLSRYDLTNSSVKEQYVGFFADRKSSPSPQSSFTAGEKLDDMLSSGQTQHSLEEQVRLAEEAVRRNQEALERANCQLAKLKKLQGGNTETPLPASDNKTHISQYAHQAVSAFNGRVNTDRS